MSRGSWIALRLARWLGAGFAVHREMVFRRPFGPVVTGWFIERSAYKDTVFIRRLVLPCWRHTGFVGLSYSTRLGDLVTGSHMFKGDAAALLEMAKGVIAKDGEPAQPDAVRGFIEANYLPASDGLRSFHGFDLGAAFLTEGDVEQAAAFFRASQAALEGQDFCHKGDRAMFADAGSLIEQMAADVPGAQQRVAAMAAETAGLMGFKQA